MLSVDRPKVSTAQSRWGSERRSESEKVLFGAYSRRERRRNAEEGEGVSRDAATTVQTAMASLWSTIDEES